LVSSRPISFQMDLYPPLYVPRPIVEPERFASLRPPMYNGALTNERAAGMNFGGGFGMGGNNLGAGGSPFTQFTGIGGLGVGGFGAGGGNLGVGGGIIGVGGFGQGGN